jgi:hypothetical protein
MNWIPCLHRLEGERFFATTSTPCGDLSRLDHINNPKHRFLTTDIPLSKSGKEHKKGTRSGEIGFNLDDFGNGLTLVKIRIKREGIAADCPAAAGNERIYFSFG